MPRDAYIRLLPFGQYRAHHTDRSAVPLLFVDVEDGAQVNDLRKVPYSYLADTRRIIMRTNPEGLDDLAKLVQRPSLSRARYAVLRHEVSSKPQLVGNIVEEEVDELLERCRAIELKTLLHWGRAIWTPRTHHYLLPSGHHAAVFVKVSDAIRQPRDAIVIASWLLERVKDGMGLVLDTGTLTAVPLALSSLMAKDGATLGRVSVLQHYPKTAVDVSIAVRQAAAKGSVLLLLSVNGSGRLRDLLVAAAKSWPGIVTEWACEMLVDFGDAVPFEQFSSWLTLSAEDLDISGPPFTSSECHLCSSERSPLLPIDPVTFDAHFPSLLKPITPSISDPTQNRKLWEICSQTDAIGFNEEPDRPSAEHRPQGQMMPIHIRFDQLLAVQEFCDAVSKRADELSITKFMGDVDLVLVPEADTKRLDYPIFWEKVGSAFCAQEVALTPYPRDHWSDKLNETVRGAKKIVILSLGTVTGTTLQQALVGVQDARTDDGYDLRAVVVHGRPISLREWITLGNSFNGDLRVLWLSLLPSRCPLNDESKVISELDDHGLSDDAVAFLKRRKFFCSSGGSVNCPDEPLFWGADINDHISSHSIYGRGLNAAATYVAVASAMEAERQMMYDSSGRVRRTGTESYRTPVRIVFHFRDMSRSYFDPLILASMLRWTRAHEAYWGRESSSVKQVLIELLERAKDRDERHLAILVPELLLAAAQGKVPSDADSGCLAVLKTYAEQVRTPPVEVGLALVAASSA